MKSARYYKIFAIIAAIMMFVVFILIVDAFNEAKTLFRKQYVEQQALLVEQSADSVENTLDHLTRELETLSKLDAVRDMDIDRARAVMERTYKYVRHMHVNDVGLMDSTGKAILALNSPELEGMDFSFREYFRKAVGLGSGVPVFELITFKGADRGQKGIIMAMPVYNRSNDFAGVVLFTLRVSDIIERMLPRMSPDRVFWAFDETGNILYHPSLEPGTSVQQLLDSSVDPDKFVAALTKGKAYEGDFMFKGGVKTLVSSHPLLIEGHTWQMVISVPEEAIDAMLRHSYYAYVAGILVIFLVISGGITFLFIWSSRLEEERGERRRAESALKDSEARFTALVNQASESIFLMDLSGGEGPVIVDANIAACVNHGYEREELIGMHIRQLDDKATSVLVEDRTERLLSGERLTFEGVHVRKDGSRFPVEVSAQTINLGDKRYILAIDRDITERKNAEIEIKNAYENLERRVAERTAQLRNLNVRLAKEIDERMTAEVNLRRQHDFLESIIESLTHPFYVVDANDYTIKMANSAANFGDYPKDATCYMLTHKRNEPCKGSDHVCPVEEVKRTKKSVVVEHVHHDKDGTPRIFEVCGYPIFDSAGNIVQVIEYNIDITMRKKLEDERQKSSTLESIGRLAAGIAHEINNPLANASLSMQILKGKLKDLQQNASIHDKLDSIERNIDKASTIARELLEFSRQKETEYIPQDMNSIIRSSLLLIEYKLKNIRVHTNFGSGQNVLADPTKLEQVFINLLMNAIEAMPEGGDVWISTALKDGLVIVNIKDTGVGIQERNLPKVFDPFYTTKRVGEGTGLGLSICYGIISQHNGDIDVSSKEGHGTVVTVRIPVYKG